MAENMSQLADAQAAVAQLETDNRTADAAMRSLRVQSNQQQEQILELQEAVLRSADCCLYGIACTA
jgi:hypothetical protein